MLITFAKHWSRFWLSFQLRAQGNPFVRLSAKIGSNPRITREAIEITKHSHNFSREDRYRLTKTCLHIFSFVPSTQIPSFPIENLLKVTRADGYLFASLYPSVLLPSEPASCFASFFYRFSVPISELLPSYIFLSHMTAPSGQKPSRTILFA